VKNFSLKKLVVTSFLCALVAPSLTYAADGIVNFSGSITDVTCDINGQAPGDGNVTNVELGRIAPGTFAAIGSASPFVPFKLQLSGAQCTNDAKVSIDFDQVENIDSVTGNLKLIGSAPATGVQIQVFNDTANGKKIQLGQRETTPQVAVVKGNTATLSYKASYVSTAPVVTPGSGISFVRYTLAYQ